MRDYRLAERSDGSHLALDIKDSNCYVRLQMFSPAQHAPKLAIVGWLTEDLTTVRTALLLIDDNALAVVYQLFASYDGLWSYFSCSAASPED